MWVNEQKQNKAEKDGKFKSDHFLACIDFWGQQTYWAPKIWTVFRYFKWVQGIKHVLQIQHADKKKSFSVLHFFDKSKMILKIY